MRSKILLFLLVVAPVTLQAQATPGWHKSVDFLSQLFDPEIALGGMAPALEKFQYVFTGIGVAMLLVGTLFKVAHAQHGEQQVGWVSTFVFSAALMVCAPAIGKQLYAAGDEVAKWTGYDKMSSVVQAYKTLNVMLSNESPATDSMSSADKAKGGGSGPSDSKTWLMKTWDWAVSVASGLKDLVKSVFLAVKNGVTYIVFTVLMIVPTISLIIATLIIMLGDLLRSILFHGMNVMMPAIIAGLSFEPVRNAAKSFLIRYVAVAFWPLAWAFGNAICFTLLGITTQWIVNTSTATLAAAAGGAAITSPAPVATAASGLLTGAASYMSWGLLFIIATVLSTISLLIILSAVMAPKWLTKSFTEGAAFIGSMMTSGVLAGVAATAAVATGGSSLIATGGASAAAMGAGKAAAGLAGRAKSMMSGMARSLQQVANNGGPMSGLAGFGAKAMNAGASLAKAGGSMVEKAGEGFAGAVSPQGGGRIASSVLNSIAGLAKVGTALGGQEGRMYANAVEGAQTVSGRAANAASNTQVAKKIGGAGGRAMRWMQRGRSAL